MSNNSYPTSAPKVKHNLISLEKLDIHDNDETLTSVVSAVEGSSSSSSSSNNNMALGSSSDEIFNKIQHTYQNASSIHPKSIAVIYSYDDGPDYPGPLSSSLLVLGFVSGDPHSDCDVVDIMLGRTQSTTGQYPEFVHCATLGVKLADATHYHRLPAKDQYNSTEFGQFMQRLRTTNSIAVIARDKYGRFGLLVPITTPSTQNRDPTNGHLLAEDCAAKIYIATVDDVQKHVTMFQKTKSEKKKKKTAKESTTTAATTTSKRKNIDNDQQKSSRGIKRPIYRPDLDGFDDDGTVQWPTYKPDLGDIDMSDFSDFDDDDHYDNDGNGTDASSSAAAAVNNNYDDADDATVPVKTTNNKMWDFNSSSHEDDYQQNQQQESSWGMHDDTNNNNDWFGNDTSSSIWANDNTTATTSHDDGDPNNDNQNDNHQKNKDQFHADAGAAAADKFYSELNRGNKDSSAESLLYHMRKFNNYVKSMLIKESEPNTQGGQGQPLRILDLACGKGGDLTKWMKLDRGLGFYFGVDVARGSLKDAAKRAREFRQGGRLHHAIFAVADLGADVLGRQEQSLLTWKMEDEAMFESEEPEFTMIKGGGIDITKHRFDIVSIQFAIHYMMQTKDRARHFFHTVSDLLEDGGNLICTTIDARVVVGKLMGLGLDLHFEEGAEPKFEEAVVSTGSGACRITFKHDIVKKLMQCTSIGDDLDENMFGLEYTFTLVEGSDHAAGVGDAVNLPEWLTPIPMLEALAKEAGLTLVLKHNFHEFYNERKNDPESNFLLDKMNALNRKGTISQDEWDISGLYCALKFRKDGKPKTSISSNGTAGIKPDNDDDDETWSTKPTIGLAEAKKDFKKFAMSMIRAKKKVGKDVWDTMSQEEQDAHTLEAFESLP